MTLADLHPVTAVILALCAGGMGGIVSAAMIFRATSRALHLEVASIAPGLGLKDIEIHTTVEIEAEDFKGRSAVKWTGHEIEAIAVERWLEARGLIAQPRGIDFAPKAKA